ncbi:MAG: hypothetical protein RI949_165 [Pseudomonadota bacterium]|jgi:oligopeptide/dipeptide ABC transporter ATP-binding protein
MPAPDTPLLQAHEVGVRFAVRGGLWRRPQFVHAVQQVSFELAAGETLAIVGESGSGKTTLARALMGLVPLHEGHFVFDGQRIAADQPAAWRDLRRQVQMVFQDPFGSLDPRWNVHDLIAEPLRLQGVSPGPALTDRVHELLRQVGLAPESASRYPHQFSGGQRQRIAIARALAPRPRVIVADEPLSALDVSIQSQVMNLLRELQRAHGLSYLLISHDFAAVHHLADRIAVMYLGRVVETASVGALFSQPAHPYTAALLASVPRVGRGKRQPGQSLAGEVPSPISPPSGCAFHPRCPAAQDRCRHEAPLVRAVPGEAHRQVACHFPRVTLPVVAQDRAAVGAPT